MNGRYRWMVGSLVALAMSSAWAGGGRIDFSGAIVTPTCTALAESEAVMASNIPPDRSFACGGRSQATATADSSVYRLSELRLDGAATAGNPLLQYFIAYRASEHAADAQMVTRIYE